MIKKTAKEPVAFRITFLILLLILSASACRTFSAFAPKSGTLLNIEVKTDEPNAEQITDLAVDILRKRLNAIGAQGEISRTAPDKIEAKIYSGADMARAKEILLAESRFELRKAVSPPNPAPLQTFPTKAAAVSSMGEAIPPNRKVVRFPDRETNNSERWIIVENPSIVDGNELRNATTLSLSKTGDDYEIIFSLTPSGAQKFGDWTGKNIGNYVAIILNDEVKSAAFIKSQIFDSGVINGRFTKRQAEDLALVMKSGYLPATLKLLDEKTFGQ